MKSLPKLIYCDLCSLEAVCLQGRQEVRFPLEEVPGKTKLYWMPAPGEMVESQVPTSFKRAVLMKKPAAKSKPKAKAKAKARVNDEDVEAERNEEREENEEEENETTAEEAEEDDAEEDEEEPIQKVDEGEGNEEEEEEAEGECKEVKDDEGEEEEEEDKEEDLEEKEEESHKDKKCQEGKKSDEGNKRFRAVRKRPCSAMEKGDEDFEVNGLYLINAATGKNLRSYLLGRCGKKRKHLIQITENECKHHQAIAATLMKEGKEKIKTNISYVALKHWAKMRKMQLLS